jgi:hypothetical protein
MMKQLHGAMQGAMRRLTVQEAGAIFPAKSLNVM